MNDLRNAKKDHNKTCQFYGSGRGTFWEKENEWEGGYKRRYYGHMVQEQDVRL